MASVSGSGSAPRAGAPRRRIAVVVAAAFVVAALFVAFLHPTADPLVVSSGSEYPARWTDREPVPWLPLLRRTVNRRFDRFPGRAWVVLRDGPMRHPRAVVAAPCGCEFEPDVVEHVSPDRLLLGWTVVDEGSVSIGVADGEAREALVVRSPWGTRSPGRIQLLQTPPWSGEFLGVRLTIDESAKSVQASFPLNVSGALSSIGIGFSDAGGRTAHATLAPPMTPIDQTAREVDVSVPIPWGSRLCPHEPWWVAAIVVTSPFETQFQLRFPGPAAR